MPNVKLYVDEAFGVRIDDVVRDCLEPLQSLLCEGLGVEDSHCHLAVLGVRTLGRGPAILVEILTTDKDGRPAEAIAATGRRAQDLLREATGVSAIVRGIVLTDDAYIRA